MYDATVMQIHSNPQVFADNALLEQVDAVTRRWHKPQRLGDGPVLKGDHPWEITPYFTYSNFNVLRDPGDDIIKCWYEDIGPVPAHCSRHPWQNRLLYAESVDGINFSKPLLGRVFEGGENTNILAGYTPGGQPGPVNPWANVGIHSAAVVIDPTSRTERYKMLFSLARASGDLEIMCAYSGDGISWQPYGQRPSFGNSLGRLSDVSTITFDPASQQFIHFTRHGGMSEAGVPVSSPGFAWEDGARFRTFFPGRPDLMSKRRVYRTTSADFLKWVDLVLVSAPDELSDNLDTAHYGMGQFCVGTTQFGTLGVLNYVDNEMEVRLIFSHDGYHWHPADRAAAFLAPRRGNAWDRHMVSIVSAPVRVGDQWYFYHGGSYAHHDWWWSGPAKLDHDEARYPGEHVKFGMGVAALRFEGVVSLESVAPRSGRMVTRPLSFKGRRLRINARTASQGSIKVAICDSAGRELAGYGIADSAPFNGDCIRHQMQWTGTDILPANQGNEYRKLAFFLDQAEIFSFVVDP